MINSFTTIGSTVGVLMENPKINPTTKKCIVKFNDEYETYFLIFEDDNAPEFIKSQKKGNKISIIGLFSNTGNKITVLHWEPYSEVDNSSADNVDEIPF